MSEGDFVFGFFLKLYTNKNYQIFRLGAKHLNNVRDIRELNKSFGVIYDDFDCKDSIREKWEKNYPGINIFSVARRRNTVAMDSKISFAKKMKDSVYTPETYFNIDETNLHCLPDDNSLFFIKKNGSTGSAHVVVTKLSKLEKTSKTISNLNEYIIQKSMPNPDLYEGKRYKIRAHVILFNKNIYFHRKPWCTISKVPYDITCDDEKILREMNVIYQANAEKFITFDIISENDKIEKNILLALEDFRKNYCDEIEKVGEKEFAILGFDFVVDAEKNVNIIEINHRSNYQHPQAVSDKTDVLCIRDLYILLFTNNTKNTDLLLVTKSEPTTSVYELD